MSEYQEKGEKVGGEERERDLLKVRDEIIYVYFLHTWCTAISVHFGWLQ